MVIYLIILGILIILAILNQAYPNNKQKYEYTAIIIMILLASLRSKYIGFDLERYISLFINDQDYLLKNTEVGFQLYNDLIRIISRKEQIYIIITSISVLFSLFLFLKKTSSNVVLSLLIFYILTNDQGYLFTFTAIRQTLAYAIVIWSYYYFNKNKYVLSVIILILSFFFHNSIIFILPLFLLSKIKVPNTFLIIALILSAIIGYLSTIKVNILMNYTRNIEIVDNYLYRYTTYLGNTERSFVGAMSIILPNLFFSLFAIRYRIENTYSKIYYYSVIISNLLIHSAHIQRYLYMTNSLIILIIPWIYQKAKDKSEKLFLTIGIIALVIFYIVFYYSLLINITDAYSRNYVVPFKFYFQE